MGLKGNMKDTDRFEKVAIELLSGRDAVKVVAGLIKHDEEQRILFNSKKDIPDPADPLGYTNEEILAICKKRKIKPKAFNKEFGVNTCAVGKDGKPRYYLCDIERALYNLGKGGKYHEWD